MSDENRTNVIVFIPTQWMLEEASSPDSTIVVESIQVVLNKFNAGNYAVLSTAYEPGVRGAEALVRILGVAHVVHSLGKDRRQKFNIRQTWEAILSQKNSEYLFVVTSDVNMLVENQPADFPEGVEIVTFPVDIPPYN